MISTLAYEALHKKNTLLDIKPTHREAVVDVLDVRVEERRVVTQPELDLVAGFLEEVDGAVPSVGVSFTVAARIRWILGQSSQ